MELPELKASQDAVEAAAKKVMLAKDPDVGPELDRMQTLISELQTNEEVRNEAANLSEPIRAKLDEFRALRTKLGPLQDAALRDPTVMPLGEKFMEQMEQAMTQIDPKAKDLMLERDRLGRQLQALQNAARGQIGAPTPSAPQPSAPASQGPPTLTPGGAVTVVKPAPPADAALPSIPPPAAEAPKIPANIPATVQP